MAESRDFQPGSASAAADAEARATINENLNPGGRPVPVGPVQGSGEEAGDAPEPEAAADTAVGVRSDEPPTPTDEPVAGDDYDEELHARGPDTDPPASDAPTDQTTKGKTWADLATDEDRRLAFEASQEELRKLKEAPPPAKIPTPEPVRRETVREVADRLTQEDPEVGQFVEGLNQARLGYEAHQKKFGELTETGAKLVKDIEKAEAILEYHEAAFKADPEDFKAREAVVQHRSLLVDLRTRANSNEIERQRVARDGNALGRQYNDGLENLYKTANSILADNEARGRKDTEDRQQADAFKSTWKQGFDRFTAQHKIPKGQLAYVNGRLLQAAYLHTDVSGDFKDAAAAQAWMLGAHGAEIARDALARDRADAATYKERKLKDAQQPGPKGNAAVATPEPNSPESGRRASEIEHRRAGERLAREIASARR